MKTERNKLLIPARIKSSRKFYLTPPAPDRERPHFYVRFDVPGKIRELNPELPKTVFRSLETDVLAVAKQRARDVIEAIFEERFEEAERMKAQAPSYATLAQVFERYQPDPRDCRPASVRNNKSMLELIIREATGRDNVADTSAAVWCDPALWQKWVQLRLARIKGSDYLAQERAAITINSTIAQARSVLSPRVMHLYTGLRLPDLAPLRAFRRLKIRADVSYQPLPQTSLQRIAAAAPQLKAEDPETYKVYLLMSRLGMRNSEVQAARWGWLERVNGHAYMVIERRPDFVPKNQARRRLRLDPGLLAELDTWRGLDGAYLIEAPNDTERYNITHRRINAWLRQFIPPGREKGAYELRKHAASVIVTRPESEGGGIAAAAAFLGDTISTTEAHYGKYLRDVRGISTAEICGNGSGDWIAPLREVLK